MKESVSLNICRQYLGEIVEVIVDRPLNSRHPKHNFVYETNYGFIPNTKAPDGEEKENLTDEEISKATHFQEQWFESEILRK